MFRLTGLVFFALIFAFNQTPAEAGPNALGPETCGKCHGDEVKVWEGTKHFKSYKKVHKNKKAKKIVKAIGGKRMKKSAVCATCHYTKASPKGGKAKLVAGPSCESCHGNASEWIAIHNDYGGAGIKRAQESPGHKAERIKKAAAAGLRWPNLLYDVAANCMSCHGLENAALSGEHASTMLDNGHPLNPDFEIVAYSQGSVRHRFYPPDMTSNKPLSKVEMARLYVIGQAAALVSAMQASSKSKHAKYVAAQNKRIATAKAILAKVPDAAAFLSAPSADAGRALAAAIAKKDLTGAVGGSLPTSFK